MFALESVNAALERRDAKTLLKCLKLPHLSLKDVKDDNAEFYLTRLVEMKEYKQVTWWNLDLLVIAATEFERAGRTVMFVLCFQNNNTEDDMVDLTKDEVQMAVQAANLDADSDYQSE